jgi:hypothetical protein
LANTYKDPGYDEVAGKQEIGRPVLTIIVIEAGTYGGIKWTIA